MNLRRMFCTNSPVVQPVHQMLALLAPQSSVSVERRSETEQRAQNWLACFSAGSMMSVRQLGHIAQLAAADSVHAARHCRWKRCPHRKASAPLAERRQIAHSAGSSAIASCWACPRPPLSPAQQLAHVRN